jgi:hypothetical protein
MSHVVKNDQVVKTDPLFLSGQQLPPLFFSATNNTAN